MSFNIQLEVSEENEGTESPWWIIIDPKQNFKTNEDGACAIAHMITGPFFSRESAEYFLNKTRYNFSKSALVWCHSGYNSNQYKNAYRKAEKEKCHGQ